jgi:signal transduction histidine kinase
MAGELNSRRAKLLKTFEALRRSRKEIFRERNFKETIVENIETGILTLDARGDVTSVNGPACRILGLDGSLVSAPLSDLFTDWPEILQALEDVDLQKEQGHWSRYVDLERNEKNLTFRIALLPLTFGDEGGRILAVEDLTERVNLRQRMERMERLASLGRLSAGIAHEVRNPLTGISLLLDELHDRLIGQTGDQVLIRRALGEMERLERLVGELLNFASQPQITLEPGDVGAVLGDSLFFIKKQCQQSGIELVELIAEDLSPLMLDQSKLKQAFLNLFTNALEAMPSGGTLTVTARKEGENILIMVRDTGEGMAPERIPLIFEPFYTSKGEGTGLGLSITHNIVSEHGGRIEVESRPGQGSSFTLLFPLTSSGG